MMHFNIDKRVKQINDHDVPKFYRENYMEDCRVKNRMNRKAFGLAYALIIVVVVASLGILSIKMSSRTLSNTTDEYIKMQLNLYASSTAEIAILHFHNQGPAADGTRKGVMQYGPNNEYTFQYEIKPEVDGIVIDRNDPNKLNEVNRAILDVSGSVKHPKTRRLIRVVKRYLVKL